MRISGAIYAGAVEYFPMTGVFLETGFQPLQLASR